VEITVLAVGKLRRSYRDAADEYIRRLRRSVRFKELEVPEASRAPTIAAARLEEEMRLRSKLAPEAMLVTLTRRGQPWSSADLARRVDRWRLVARPVSILLGGSHGLANRLIDEAAERWSLGPLTLPHEVARVVLVEQLYRAYTILRGEPYHKGAE